MFDVKNPKFKTAIKKSPVKALKDDLITSTQKINEITKIATLTIGEPQEIDIDKLIDFPKHTYNMYNEERMKELEKSIKNYGLQQPIILWDKGNKSEKYIILAGHNRVKACKNIGYTKVPAIIKKDITESEATIIVNETNMLQRSFAELSIYEKAASIYQMKEAIKKYNKEHNKEEEKNSNDIIKRECGIEQAMAYHYYNLYENYSKEQFELFDNGIFDVLTGIELINISNKKDDLIQYIKDNKITKVNKQQAKELTDLYKEKNDLSFQDFNNVLILNKDKKAEKMTIPRNKISMYFKDGTTEDEMWKKIIALLEEQKDLL